MTSIRKRCLKNFGIRLNYAKPAKECGMKHINVLEIRQYLREDWETKIESLKGGITWDTITHNLLKKDIYEIKLSEFRKLSAVLSRNGVNVNLLRYQRRNRISAIRYMRKQETKMREQESELNKLRKIKLDLIEEKKALEMIILQYRLYDGWKYQIRYLTQVRQEGVYNFKKS